MQHRGKKENLKNVAGKMKKEKRVQENDYYYWGKKEAIMLQR